MSDTTAASHERLHAMDGLRASMMLLGVVFHVALFYMTPDYAWPKDPYSTIVGADIIVIFSHAFRMPVFFVLAGFFTAMLYLRRSPAAFLKGRFQRIGIPLVAGSFLLWPFIAISFAVAAAMGLFKVSPLQTSEATGLSDLLIPAELAHLWFLYDLLIFYSVFVVLAWGCQFLSENFRSSTHSIFRSAVLRPILRLVILIALTTLTLIPMDGAIFTASQFIPDLSVLILYFVFFGFGWMLYFQKDVLSSFIGGAWTQIIIGSITGIVFAIGLEITYEQTPSAQLPVLLKSINGATTAWLMFFGLTGIFLRYFDKPSARMRYMVDASYWVYLVHLPLIFLFPLLLANVEISAWIKMPVSISAAAIVCFVSYDLFVRSTFIGKALNGRRYTRGLPELPR